MKMCVVALAWQFSEEWPLILIGNRDEHHARPAAALSNWQDGSGIIAGRDLQSGGTWLGVTEGGRLAVITNVRHPDGPDLALKSRGEIVTRALLEGVSSLTGSDGTLYNPFNLLLIDEEQLFFASNAAGTGSSALQPGVYGVSNGKFDEPWPKVNFLKRELAVWLAENGGDFSQLHSLLADEGASGRYGGKLPKDTSQIVTQHTPAFIRHPIYGTRCSTVVAVRADQSGLVSERSFDPNGVLVDEISIPFNWPSVAVYD